jgi:hypothetical protein
MGLGLAATKTGVNLTDVRALRNLFTAKSWPRSA